VTKDPTAAEALAEKRAFWLFLRLSRSLHILGNQELQLLRVSGLIFAGLVIKRLSARSHNHRRGVLPGLAEDIRQANQSALRQAGVFRQVRTTISR
jgi:hypothetical protein